MTNEFTPNDALHAAVAEGARSPCAKSKRGVVIFTTQGLLAGGHNHPPDPFRCDGSKLCRRACTELCIHAEEDAMQHVIMGPSKTSVVSNWSGMLTQMNIIGVDLQMLHVKVVDGKAVPSREPSCWQCSKSILGSGKIDRMWLLREDELRSYTPLEFHEATLRNCWLPVIKEST